MKNLILKYADIDTRRALGIYSRVHVPDIQLARWARNGFWAEYAKDQFRILWLFKYGFAILKIHGRASFERWTCSKP